MNIPVQCDACGHFVETTIVSPMHGLLCERCYAAANIKQHRLPPQETPCVVCKRPSFTGPTCGFDCSIQIGLERATAMNTDDLCRRCNGAGTSVEPSDRGYDQARICPICDGTGIRDSSKPNQRPPTRKPHTDWW